ECPVPGFLASGHPVRAAVTDAVHARPRVQCRRSRWPRPRWPVPVTTPTGGGMRWYTGGSGSWQYLQVGHPGVGGGAGEVGVLLLPFLEQPLQAVLDGDLPLILFVQQLLDPGQQGRVA